MADFYLRVGDRLPVLRATLLTADSTAVDLTAATSVTFTLAAADGTVAIAAGACTTVIDVEEGIDATDGIVEYAWTAGDTDTAGDYSGRFVVTYPTSLPVSMPNDRNLAIIIA